MIENATEKTTKKEVIKNNMVETKVRLSMEVPGATMLSSQDCEKMSKKDSYNHSTVGITYQVKKGKKLVTKKDTLHIYTRKSRSARQSLCISKEAYEYMTDKFAAPSAVSQKVWGNLSNTKRLEYHLKLIAESLGATAFSYEVLDD